MLILKGRLGCWSWVTVRQTERCREVACIMRDAAASGGLANLGPVVTVTEQSDGPVWSMCSE